MSEIDQEAIAQACQALGRRLAECRRSAGYSQAELARYVAYSRSTIANVEAGRQNPPRDFWERCESALFAEGALVAAFDKIGAMICQYREDKARAAQAERAARFWEWQSQIRANEGASSDDGDDRLLGAEPDGDLIAVPVVTKDGRLELMTISRRRFLQAGGISFAALGLDALNPLGTATAQRIGQVGAAEVEEARAVVRQLYAMGSEFGGDKVQPLTVAQLRRVHRLINEGTYTEQVGRGLHSAAGEAAEYAGWLAFDAWRHDEARFYFNEAVSMARLGQDELLSMHVLASMSLQSTNLNRPREALNMLMLAQDAVSRCGNPKLMSLLAAREALAQARMGDGSGSQKSLTRARCRLEGTGDSEQSWLNFYDNSVITYYSALCHADLDHHEAAVPLFREALLARRSASRGMAMRQSDFARSLMCTGEVEEACHLAGQAVDQLPEVSSERVNHALRGVILSVPPSAANTPAVKDLTEKLAAAGVS